MDGDFLISNPTLNQFNFAAELKNCNLRLLSGRWRRNGSGCLRKRRFCDAASSAPHIKESEQAS
jgi:hypothetical protein